MEPREAYDHWSAQYDTNKNRTRDLEGMALRESLSDLLFERALEIGCGTGKNTEWLVTRCEHVTAVDLSPGMLERARAKIPGSKVQFEEADILGSWDFAVGLYDLIAFSLVLEHVEDLFPILWKAARVLRPGGLVYIGELHPFKQYSGTKARFTTATGEQEVSCFVHHISDFAHAARTAGLVVEDLREYFDAEDRNAPPRVLVLVLRK